MMLIFFICDGKALSVHSKICVEQGKKKNLVKIRSLWIHQIAGNVERIDAIVWKVDAFYNNTDWFQGTATKKKESKLHIQCSFVAVFNQDFCLYAFVFFEFFCIVRRRNCSMHKEDYVFVHKFIFISYDDFQYSSKFIIVVLPLKLQYITSTIDFFSSALFIVTISMNIPLNQFESA